MTNIHLGVATGLLAGAALKRRPPAPADRRSLSERHHDELHKLGWSRVGRNTPCPCGGKDKAGKPVKFKHCHLRVGKFEEDAIVAMHNKVVRQLAEDQAKRDEVAKAAEPKP